jgi:CheY-like chemotaxis protein
VPRVPRGRTKAITVASKDKEGPLVLVVDDDALVADMLRRALGRRGFRIEAVSSPEEALALAAHTPFQAALVDLVMPGLDGADLAGQLRGLIPGLPIAVLTGYTHSPLLHGAEKSSIAVFAKPIVMQELVEFLEAQIQ